MRQITAKIHSRSAKSDSSMLGNLRQTRRNQPEEHLYQTYCIHRLSNAVVVWNTVSQGRPALKTADETVYHEPGHPSNTILPGVSLAID